MPRRAGGAGGKGDNAAGSAPAPSQVGGHCKNIPTLEYGFLVQVRSCVLLPRVLLSSIPLPSASSPLPHVLLIPVVLPGAPPEHCGRRAG